MAVQSARPLIEKVQSISVNGIWFGL